MNPILAFKDSRQARHLSEAIARKCTRSWRIMEICGGQTHALAKYGIEEMLPQKVTLIHGPGCPVCVTPTPVVDCAVKLAERPEIILATFGDMIRVPGSRRNLQQAKSEGADVRILYSPLDAVRLAIEHPKREVVFFAIGFETTAPVHALTLLEARRKNVENFSLLPSLFTVPTAIDSLVADPENRIDGVLAAGHVCAVTGYDIYRHLAVERKLPMAVTGFEPLDLLYGIYVCIDLLENSRYEVINAYRRIVRPEGNVSARNMLEEVFEPADQEWRGLGRIAMSGLKIKDRYKQFDAFRRFQISPDLHSEKEMKCRSGEIMKGRIHPRQCPYFGKTCTPEHPSGAPMISSEGACAAYYRYQIKQNRYENHAMSVAP